MSVSSCRASRWYIPFVVLAGCEPCTPTPTTPPDTTPVTQRQEAPPTTYAVDQLRLVAWVDTTALPAVCPAPDATDWTVAPLFADGPDTPTDELSQFCLYERSATGTSAAPFAGIKGALVQPETIQTRAGETLWVSHDHTGLAPAAIAEDELRDWYLRRFDEAAGVPRRDPFPDGQSPRLTSVITRLTVLDTAATSTTGYPDSAEVFQGAPSHGLAIATLAQLMTCVDRVECPVEIQSRQVMGLTSTSYSPQGEVVQRSYGTIAELARGIRLAVADWKRAGGPRTGHLVLNMSLAWHPFFGGGMPGGYGVNADGRAIDLRDGSQAKFSWDAVDPKLFAPDVRAVFDALAFARCQGALAFSAAGNTTAGPKGGSGPLMPAAWEAFPTSRLAVCPGAAAAVDARQPLVVAVGGVEPGGNALATSRPDSQPLFVAVGDHAWYAPQFSNEPTTMEPMTGTSVSTVVVSSTAAAMWTLHPTWTPFQVLSELAASAEAATEVSGWARATAAERFGEALGDASRSRRVRACNQLTSDSGASYVCKITEAPASFSVVSSNDPTDAVLTWPGTPGTDPACGDRQLFTKPTASGAAEADPCPSLQYFGPAISPWVNPQPSTAGCGLCFLDTTLGRLYIQLPDLGQHKSLVVTVKTSTAEVEFALPSSAIAPDQTQLLLQFQPENAPAGIQQALLSGVKDGRAVVYPMLVLP